MPAFESVMSSTESMGCRQLCPVPCPCATLGARRPAQWPGAANRFAQTRAILVAQPMCGICHTQTNPTGIYRGDDYYLAGGMRVGVYPHAVYISRNLTPGQRNRTGELDGTANCGGPS